MHIKPNKVNYFKIIYEYSMNVYIFSSSVLLRSFLEKIFDNKLFRLGFTLNIRIVLRNKLF